MRYKRQLNKEQIQYLIDHSDKSNKQLAEEFKVSANVVAIYKWRLRQAGIDMPRYSKNPTVMDEIKTLKK